MEQRCPLALQQKHTSLWIELPARGKLGTAKKKKDAGEQALLKQALINFARQHLLVGSRVTVGQASHAPVKQNHRQEIRTLIQELGQQLVLAPYSTFWVLNDLQLNRHDAISNGPRTEDSCAHPISDFWTVSLGTCAETVPPVIREKTLESVDRTFVVDPVTQGGQLESLGSGLGFQAPPFRGGSANPITDVARTGASQTQELARPTLPLKTETNDPLSGLPDPKFAKSERSEKADTGDPRAPGQGRVGDAPALALPTDSKELQNQRRKRAKELGIEIKVNKIWKHVEEHYDDCGDDITSIGGFLTDDLNNVPDSEDESTDSEDAWYHEEDDFGVGLSSISLFGAVEILPSFRHVQVVQTSTFVEAELTLLACPIGIDVAELCGGEARASRVGIRRSLKTGKNFDIVTECDLNVASEQLACRKYFLTQTVLVALMAPTCKPFGILGQWNETLYPTGWLRGYNDAAPHGRLCGEIALVQLQKGLHFLCEQPEPSTLYKEFPWTEVTKWKCVIHLPWDRCQTGLTSPEDGLPAKKPSAWKASNPYLVAPFYGKRCVGASKCCEHANTLGGRAAALQVWTWTEAELVVSGICALKKWYLRHKGHPNTTGKDVMDSLESGKAFMLNQTDWPWLQQSYGVGRDGVVRLCKGCNSPSTRTNDSDHVDPDTGERWADCRYKDAGIPIFHPTCRGCLEPRKQRTHHWHDGTDGCRWGPIHHPGSRIPHSRAGVPRSGAAPRAPREPAHYDPTQDMGPGELADVEEMCKEAIEAETRDEERLKKVTAGKRAPEGNLTDDDPPIPRRGQRPRGSGDPDVAQDEAGGNSADGSSGPSGRNRRGPDQAKRERHDVQWEDKGVGPETPADWTSFDIGTSLRAIRVADKMGRGKILRKLHLRWWHATREQMRRLLWQAGLPKDILDMIPAIVDTCRVCRAWAKPQPDSQANVNLADGFNVQVEIDIMYYEDHLVCHMICRCTRWHASEEIKDRETETILNAVMSMWLRTHGPMKELIGDGEKAWARAMAAEDFWQRRGILMHVRAPEQHARFIERRGALLRHSLHLVDGQLAVEGLTDIPFPSRLGEATFAGNAMIAVDGCTPYAAVYGRVPCLLPNLHQNPDPVVDGADTPMPGLIKHSHRLREITVAKMVEATARARVNRALETRTLPSGKDRYQLGDEVEIHRTQSTADQSGWQGPATVVDTTKFERGIIGVKFRKGVMDVRLGDLRRWMGFLCMLMLRGNTAVERSRAAVEAAFRDLSLGSNYCDLGWFRPQGKWQKTTKTEKMGNLYRAFMHLAEVGFHLTGTIAIRYGIGSTMLPAAAGFTNSTLIWWLDDLETHNITWFTGPVKALSLKTWVGAEAPKAKYIQFLQVSDPTMVEASREQERPQANQGEVARPRPTASPAAGPTVPQPVPNVGDPLSPIQEEDSDLGSDEEWAESLFIGDQPNLQHACLLATKAILEDDGSQYVGTHGDEKGDGLDEWEQWLLAPQEPSDILTNDGWHNVCPNYHAIASNARVEPEPLPPDTGIEEDNYVDFEFSGWTAKLVHERPRDPVEGEVLVLRVFQSGIKRAVIERDTDLLTPAELITHKQEVEAAMTKEFHTWNKFKCISRKWKAGAQNVIDCKWVYKWKWEGTGDQKRRIIRARLTVRGFKDRQAQDVSNYSGTSQRYSQRVVVSEAVRRRWPLYSADINKAFLQGVTYEELAEMTGEPIREVNFVLPPLSVPFIRQVPGFESFNPMTEVLHCDKPGTGLVDAPRAFNMKLHQVVEGAGCTPITVDRELCVRHVKRDDKWELVLIVAMHVDDLKVTGEDWAIKEIFSKIESVFGDLTKVSYNFTNCGVRHCQDEKTFEVTLDQTEYLSALKPIVHAELVGANAATTVGEELQQLYMSLLGAAAFCLLTRIDVAIFLVALQRRTQSAQVIHVKRLNAVVRWMQRHPKKLCYRTQPAGPSWLKCISDSAFKKETDSGHAVKGAIFLRTASSSSKPIAATTEPYAVWLPSEVAHILDFFSKTQRHVTRSTFSSELFAACDTVDHGLLLATILHQVTTGAVTINEARHLRERGGWAIRIILAVDAYSVYSAVTAQMVKTPAEQSLLAHLQYLRELLDEGILEYLSWLDTRDMASDGLTKGSVERTQLHQLMDGLLCVSHEASSWRSPLPLAKARSAQAAAG